jgi:hypothetical protein
MNYDKHKTRPKRFFSRQKEKKRKEKKKRQTSKGEAIMSLQKVYHSQWSSFLVIV